MSDSILLTMTVVVVAVAIGLLSHWLARAVRRAARRHRRHGGRMPRFSLLDGADGRAEAARADTAFAPTQVMSYAEAVAAGWFEAAAGMAPARPVRPRLRVKLRVRDAAARFATLTVVRLTDEDGERTLYAERDDRDGVSRIPLARIEAAIDLESRSRIDDPWAWLRSRGLRIETVATGLGRAGAPDERGAVDTAIQTA